MTVGIPCFAIDRGRSGIGRYVINMLQQFSTLDETFDLVFSARDESILPKAPNLLRIQVPDNLSNPVANIAFHVTALWGLALARRWRIAFFPAANRRLPLFMPCPTVGTVHDLASLHVPRKYDRMRTFYTTRVLPKLIERLDKVIVPSESTKRDVLEAAGMEASRVAVVPLGIDHEQFRPMAKDTARQMVLERYGICKPFFIYVSRIEHPGKNHIGLIQGFEIAKKRARLIHQLVFAGEDWTGAETVRRFAESSSVREDIKFLGFVPPEFLRALYCASVACVYPSFFEGFGLPVLEAMACGTPVACSDCSSLPEVAGDSAILFSPDDPKSIADAMERLASDERLGLELASSAIARAKKFTWKKTALLTLEVFRELACTN